MKANRKFVEADEAVSPVIAVILMVAITVVLAATVFVLVSDIGSNTSQQGPQMGWAESEPDDEFTITQGPSQVNWDEFEIKCSAPGTECATGAGTIVFALNAQAATGGTDLDVNYQPVSTAIAVEGGDSINFCNDVAATGADDVKITIRHAPSNSIAQEFTFSNIATC